jgi:putative methyltransferase
MLKIYLADLVYDTIKTNYVVPLNVAYLAACANERYQGEIDITIFKYPKNLEQAMRDGPPDILGLSHYSWNSRLDILFTKLAKRLNPDVITVMGGPHIRPEPHSIQAYLSEHRTLDYYILNEGEEPFSALVDKVFGGDSRAELPSGCAAIVDGELVFEPISFNKQAKQIDLPSPYLSGWLDPFLADTNMIPLFETNRGCPFGCVYCTWGISALSKVRQRPLEVVFEEIDYVAEKSVGQVNWIFCDANFGLLARDVDIAKKIRKVINKKGYPINVTLWYSKNTSQRNIEITKIVGSKTGYVAIQSADPVVLKSSGRGNICIEDLKSHVDYYKDNGSEVATDILIGLPDESAESHLKTLNTAFDIGFNKICPYNIRLLPGSKYESDEYRRKYDVKTKYRPVFGAYGIYDGKIVLELEESVRATKDMSEEKLDSFKVLHWLIYFMWNSGLFRPVLHFGQQCGVNPCAVLHRLSSSAHPLLKETFQMMKQGSMEEWFDRPEEMISFYKQEDNFGGLVNNFNKLNFLYIAVVYQNIEIYSALENELVTILMDEVTKLNKANPMIIEGLLDFTSKLLCKDLLQEEFCIRKKYPGEVASIALDRSGLSDEESVEVEIYRDAQAAAFCDYHLKRGDIKDYSLKNLARFFEIGGAAMLVNKARIIQ